MYTIHDLLPADRAADPNAIEARVRMAYVALSEGRGSQADFDIVLIDLAQTSGYFEMPPPTASAGELHDHNGARRVFGRILYVLGTPKGMLEEMATALQESPILTTEQE